MYRTIVDIIMDPIYNASYLHIFNAIENDRQDPTDQRRKHIISLDNAVDTVSCRHLRMYRMRSLQVRPDHLSYVRLFVLRH